MINHANTTTHNAAAAPTAPGTICPRNPADVPGVFGRCNDSDPSMGSVRAPTHHLVSCTTPFDGAAIGNAAVTIFESNHQMDEGGLVIRCTTDNQASAFLPHAVIIPGGIEIHIAGDEESDAYLSALLSAIAQATQIRKAAIATKAAPPPVLLAPAKACPQGRGLTATGSLPKVNEK